MRIASVIVAAAVLGAAAPAGAEAPDPAEPTLEEARAFVTGLVEALQAEPPATPSGALARPFFYDGLVYLNGDAAQQQACRKCHRGTGAARTDAALAGLAACLPVADWSYALDEQEWRIAGPRGLPRPLRKHKARVAALDKTHVLVLGHFLPAGPAEYWKLYAVKRGAGGRLQLSAVFMAETGE